MYPPYTLGLTIKNKCLHHWKETPIQLRHRLGRGDAGEIYLSVFVYVACVCV